MSEFAMREICNEEYPPKSNSGPGIIYCDYILMILTPSTWEKYKKSVDILEHFEKHG